MGTFVIRARIFKQMVALLKTFIITG